MLRPDCGFIGDTRSGLVFGCEYEISLPNQHIQGDPLGVYPKNPLEIKILSVSSPPEWPEVGNHLSLPLCSLSADNLRHGSFGVVFDPFEVVDDLPIFKPLPQLLGFQ